MSKRNGFILAVWPCGEDKPMYLVDTDGDWTFTPEFGEALVFDDAVDAYVLGDEFIGTCPNLGYDETCSFVVAEVSE